MQIGCDLYIIDTTKVPKLKKVAYHLLLITDKHLFQKSIAIELRSKTV